MLLIASLSSSSANSPAHCNAQDLQLVRFACIVHNRRTYRDISVERVNKRSLICWMMMVQNFPGHIHTWMTFGEYMSISNSNGLGKFWASISTSCSMSLVNRGLLAPRKRATGRPLAQNKKVGRMSLQEQNQNVQHNAASQNF